MAQDGTIVAMQTTHGCDYLRCAVHSNAQCRGRNSCRTITLPDHLQGVDKALLDDFVADAGSGHFPFLPHQAMDRCVALPMTFAGPYCRNSAVNGFETVKVSNISCSFRYQFFIHEYDGKPLWAIVIGYGAHQHAVPFPRPDPKLARITVRNRLGVYGNTSTRELMREIVDEHGSHTSVAALQRYKHDFKIEQIHSRVTLMGCWSYTPHNVLPLNNSLPVTVVLQIRCMYGT